MSISNTTVFDSNGVHAFDPAISKAVKFWLIVFSESVSIPCYLFVASQYISRKELRMAPHNHALLIKLFINFVILTVDLSMHLSFLRTDRVLPSTEGACLLWQLVDYGFWFGDVFLTCWMSIERYIFIFYINLVDSKLKRYIFHYIPMVICAIYCPVFYIYLIFFYPAEHIYDYSLLLCGGPYYYNGIPTWLIWYESLVNYVIPIFVTVILSSALIVRVLVQKIRLRQAGQWRKYRKMLVQFICISAIYVFDLPYIIVTIVRWSGIPDFGSDLQGPYFYYVNYLPTILLSFTLLGTIPQLKETTIALIHCRKPQRSASVAPYMTFRY